MAEYIDLIKTARLNPKIIDVDTFALQNIYETLPETNIDEVTLLVDAGASKTSLNILKGNVSMLIRDNVSGTNQIVKALSSRLEITPEEADELLLGKAASQENQAIITEISQEMANIWCSEICEVVHTFHANGNDVRVQKIILSGGGGFV